jgi:hypothetical protein
MIIMQGCQIFIDTIYQNGGKYTKITTTLPNGHKVYQMAVKYSKLVNVLTYSSLWPSRNYPNWNFWFKNIPSGNPVIMDNNHGFLGVMKGHYYKLNYDLSRFCP